MIGFAIRRRYYTDMQINRNLNSHHWTPIRWTLLAAVVFLPGCDLIQPMVQETPQHYEVQKGVSLTLVLQTPLSCNRNARGDQFVTHLKYDLRHRDATILPQKTPVRGLVNRVTQYKRFGDRASLVLSFDQVVVSTGVVVPLQASLDTSKGANAILVQGKALKNVKVVEKKTLVGALAGKMLLPEQGLETGILVGAALGTGAVIISEAKTIELPADTELSIKLDEPLLIPK